MKLKHVMITLLVIVTYSQAKEIHKMSEISKIESRKSISVNKSAFKDYFSGGEVRIEMLYPQSDAKTHGGAYVTFEPGARTNWHSHPAGQHIIVTSGVGYFQVWGEKLQTIVPGDVIWVPIGVKHWHGASKEIAMTHLVITGADEKGENAQWLESVSDDQYNEK